MIKKAKKLASDLCDIVSDLLSTRGESKKRVTEAEDQRKKKYGQKQRREDNERSKDIHNVVVYVHSFFSFGMYHIKNLKVKDIRLTLVWNFRS